MKPRVALGIVGLLFLLTSLAPASQPPGVAPPPLQKLPEGFPKRIEVEKGLLFIKSAGFGFPGCSRKVEWEGRKTTAFAQYFGKKKTPWLAQEVKFSATFTHSQDEENELAQIGLNGQRYSRDSSDAAFLVWDPPLPWKR